ncbi:Spore coat protein S [compost metagenome]
MELVEWQVKHLLHDYDLYLYGIDEMEKNRWRIETNNGVFLLEKTGEHPTQLYFVASWLHYLYTQGVKSVVPFSVTKYGEPYIATKYGMYTLQPWIDETEAIWHVPEWEAKVLSEVGRIHQVSIQAQVRWRGYAPVSLEQIRQRWKNSIAQITLIAEVAEQNHGAEVFEKMVKRSIEQVLHFAEYAVQELSEAAVRLEGRHLMRALCHGRIHRRNIIVGATGAFYITRFERANLDTPVRDLAIFFRRYAPRCEWSIRRGRKWLAAYEEENPLTEEERLLLSCYLLFPERLAHVARTYLNTAEGDREHNVQQWTQTWQKHLRLLSEMHQFALAIKQK